MGLVVLIYFVGMLTSVTVMRLRAGLGFWHGLKVFGPGGVGLQWFATAVGMAMVWPASLAIWLAAGRPEPRVLFNEKAAARRAELERAALDEAAREQAARERAVREPAAFEQPDGGSADPSLHS